MRLNLFCFEIERIVVKYTVHGCSILSRFISIFSRVYGHDLYETNVCEKICFLEKCGDKKCGIVISMDYTLLENRESLRLRETANDFRIDFSELRFHFAKTSLQ